MSAFLDSMSEAELQAAAIETAELHGWLWHHETDSRRSGAGFPDVVFAKAPRLMIVEFKTQKGRLTPEQQIWNDELERCTIISSGVVRPAQLDGLQRKLAG